MAEGINIGGIYADLDVNSDNMVRGLANGRKAMAAIQAELQQLEKDLTSNAISTTAYSDRLQELGQTFNELASRMGTASTAVQATAGGLDVLNAKYAKSAEQQQAADDAAYVRAQKLQASAEAAAERKESHDEAAYAKETQRLLQLKATWEANAARQAELDFQAEVREAERIAKIIMDEEKLESQRQQAAAKQQAADDAAYVRAQKMTVNAIAADAKRLAAIQAAAAKASQMANGIENSTARAAGLARGLMQVGYIVDDIQYGFQSIVNNVGPATQSLAQGIGASVVQANMWGAALQIGAVATYQIYKHWEDISDAIMGAENHTRTETEQMEELRKATKLTADEAERLYRFEQLRTKGKELAEAKTTSEAESEKTATHAITEAGIKSVVAGVRKNAPAMLEGVEGVLAAKIARDEIKNEDIGHIDPRTGERIVTEGDQKDRQDRLLAAEKAYADALDRAAATITSSATLTQLFPQGPGQLAGLVRQHPNDFGPNSDALLGGLEQAQHEADKTPGERQRAKIDKAVGKVFADFREKFDKAIDNQVKENNKTDKKINKGDEKTQAQKLKDDSDYWNTLYKQRKEETREEEREDQAKVKANEKFKEDAYKKAREANPNLDRLGEQLGLAQAWGLMSRDEAVHQLNAQLKASGLNADEALSATGRVLHEGDRAAQDHAEDMQYGNHREPSNSQVYGVSDLSHIVQSAISDKPTRHQTKMETLLQSILDKTGITYGLTPG